MNNKMSKKEQDLVTRLLKQSIVSISRETMSYDNCLEIDAIICLNCGDDARQIVVKIHEKTFKRPPQKSTIDNYRSDSYESKTASWSPNQAAPSTWDELRKSPVHDNSPLDDSDSSIIGQDAGDSYGASSIDDMEVEVDTRPEGHETQERNDNAEEDGNDKRLLSPPSMPVFPTYHHLKRSLSCQETAPPEIDLNDTKLNSDAFPTPKRNDTSRPRQTLVVQSTDAEAKTTWLGLACKRCEKVLPDSKSFETHSWEEHSVFMCPICYSTFTARNNLQRHIRLHTGYKPHSCPICNKGFTRKDDLKGHMLKHSYSKPFRCNLCCKGYEDRSCLRNHMVKGHASKLVNVCTQCGEGFNDSSKYEIHKKSHPELKHFQCQYCDFVGKNPLECHKHMLVHGPDTTYTCCYCEESFGDAFDYTHHVKSHRNDENCKAYACCFCASKLASYDQFVRHEHSHAQEKNHTCPVCGKQFLYPSNLKEHMMIHKSNDDDSKISADEPSADILVSSQSRDDHEQPYWCTECQKGFGSEESLHDHINSVHESNTILSPDFTDDESDGHDSDCADNDVNVPDINGNIKSKNREPVTIDIPYIELKKPDEEKLKILRNTHSLDNGSISQFKRQTSEQAEDLSSAVKQEASSRRNITSPGILNAPRVLSHRRISSTSSSAGADDITRHSPSVIVNGSGLTSIKREMSTESDDCSVSSNKWSGGYSACSKSEIDNDRFRYQLSEPSTPDDLATSPLPVSERQQRDCILDKIRNKCQAFERVVTPAVPFKERGPFSCFVCEDVFDDFTTFDNHSSQMHRQFVCEFCGKVFTAKPNRDRHVRYHTGEKPYKCEICSQCFFRGDDLKYHRTTRHSSVKPFICSVCGMAYAWPKDLERHVRLHTYDEQSKMEKDVLTEAMSSPAMDTVKT